MADLQYICPACAAPIAYDINRSLMACAHCLSTFTVEEVEAYSRQLPQDEESALSSNEERGLGEPQIAAEENAREPRQEKRREAGSNAGRSWEVNDGTTLDATTDAQFSHLQCNSCGAQIVADPEVISTRCAYCNNTLVAVSRMEATRVPEVILPFQIDREAMIKAFLHASTGKFLLPPQFRSRHVIREAVGMYVPFWLYDGRAEGTMHFDAHNSHEHREGDYHVTTTSSFRVMRSGAIDFHGIPVCASVHVERERADAVEPFDASKIVPFQTAYLAGYAAQSFTIPSAQAHHVGESRAIQSLADYLSSTVNYQRVTVQDQDVTFHEGKVTYALLPMWFLNIEYQRTLYQFIINGQTGEVVGTFPVSSRRLWRLRLAYFLVGFLGGGAVADMLLNWIAG